MNPAVESSDFVAVDLADEDVFEPAGGVGPAAGVTPEPQLEHVVAELGRSARIHP